MYMCTCYSVTIAHATQSTKAKFLLLVTHFDYIVNYNQDVFCIKRWTCIALILLKGYITCRMFYYFHNSYLVLHGLCVLDVLHGLEGGKPSPEHARLKHAACRRQPDHLQVKNDVAFALRCGSIASCLPQVGVCN